MCSLELGARLDSQLAPEDGGVVAVNPERARTISRERHHPHQLAAGLLVGGLLLEQALEVAESGGVLARGFEQRGEPRERAPVEPSQPFPVTLDPGVVAAGEQLAAVELHGPLQRRALLRLSPAGRGLGHRGLEGGDVELEGRIDAPAGGPRVREEEALRLGQRVAQLVEDLPEVVAGLRLARVRPEGEGQVLAKLRRVAVEEQVAEERVQPRRVDGGHRMVAVHQAEPAEEADVQGLLRAHGAHLTPAPGTRGTLAMLACAARVTPALRFVLDDLSGAAIRALIARHLDGMHASSPPESVHAFDVDRLRQPGVTFWSVWVGDDLAGCGALKVLDAERGELKSMRVADRFLGRGIGRAMLEYLTAEARARGLRSLWVETGSSPAFVPALRLYESAGFQRCGPFGDYREDPFSVFMTREL